MGTSVHIYITNLSKNFQILDMSDSELESLARHLGHDVQTHRQNYRLSHATRELTVVSIFGNNFHVLIASKIILCFCQTT